MRILNVNHMLDPQTGGGTAERTFQMSRFLARTGVRCSVVTTDIGLTPERLEPLRGVEVAAYPCLVPRFFIPRVSYKELERQVETADAVHLMGHWTVLNALVYLIARRLNKPYVVCPAGALVVYGRSRLLKTAYNGIIGKKIICNARACIAITPAEVSDLRSYGVAADKVVVIPNGIALEDIPAPQSDAFRARHGLTTTRFVLFMGRLNDIKGPDLLLRAFCRLKDRLPAYHLVFAGPDAGMLSELKKIAAQNRVESRIHFLGYLGGVEKFQAYYAADLLAIPSRREAMSMVVLEAGVTGTPVLLTDQCGFDELRAIHGGQVVPASVDGLENGLVEILGDSSRLKPMGENLKKYVVERFAWDFIVKEYVELYRRIALR